jgi:general secretion pathway protein L
VSARLIICLPETVSDDFDWAVISPDGEVLAEGRGGAVEGLPEGTAITSTVALVPADRIHVRQLTIPARSERAAQEAAPFAIEEYLAAPLDTQSVACGTADGANRRWVAALDISLAGPWRELLERIAIRPVFGVSEALLLPAREDELVIAAMDGRMAWRHVSGGEDKAGGFPEALSALVLPALAASAEPGSISLSGGQAHHYAALEGHRLRQGAPLDVYRAAAALDDATLKAAAPIFGARLSASMDWAAALQPWRRVAVLALIAGALALTGVAAEAFWLSRQAERYEAASLAAFTDAFPDIRRVVNPRVQLAQRLRELEAVEGGSDTFLALAAALAGVIGEAPHIEITAVRFQADSPALSVAARYQDFSDFEALRSAGEAAGLVLEDAGARQGADGVNGEFVVRWRE